MADNVPAHPDGHAENPTTRYERSDVNARPIVMVGVVMIVGAVVVHLVAWWIFDYLQARDKALKQSPFPLAATEPKEPPPEPRLEQVIRMEPKVNLAVGGAIGTAAKLERVIRMDPRANGGPLYAAERKELETYGWVDEKERVVRIPIEQAMRLIVEEKRLPAREEKAKSDEEGRRP
jgi:hypothetical protein